jgi:hypothetical protein
MKNDNYSSAGNSLAQYPGHPDCFLRFSFFPSPPQCRRIWSPPPIPAMACQAVQSGCELVQVGHAALPAHVLLINSSVSPGMYGKIMTGICCPQRLQYWR